MAFKENGIVVVTPESKYHDNRNFTHKTAGLTIQHEYTNFTKGSLYMKTQNNLPFVIEPNTIAACAEYPRPNLEIKITYTIHSGSSIYETLELLRGLVANGQTLSTDAQHLLGKLTDLYNNDASKNNKLNFQAVIFRRISEDEIRRQRMIYIRDTDTLISVDKEKMVMPHPNSNEGLQQTDVEHSRKNQGQAGVFIKVIDNLSLAKVRYFYAGKSLIAVPSIIAESMDSGVYYTRSTTAKDGLLAPVSSFMTFEEAETEIGLYKTQEEAMSHGDPEQILRADEAKSKAEERRLTIELRDSKHQAELEATRREEELARMKHSLELIRNENTQLKEAVDTRKLIREDAFDTSKRHREDYYDNTKRHREDYYDTRDKGRKDYYEDRSHERKDTSELIKFVPALLLGMVGTFAFMKAQKA